MGLLALAVKPKIFSHVLLEYPQPLSILSNLANDDAQDT